MIRILLLSALLLCSLLTQSKANSLSETERAYFTLSGSGSYDLSITKLADMPGPFSPGQEVTFSIIVSNEGDCDAANVEVTDFLPMELSLSMNDTNGWLSTGGVITNTIALVPTSNQETLQVLLTIDPLFSGMFITNQAAITADDGDDIDSDPDAGFADDEDGDGDPLDDDESEVTIELSPILYNREISLDIDRHKGSIDLVWSALEWSLGIEYYEVQTMTNEWVTIDEITNSSLRTDYRYSLLETEGLSTYYRIIGVMQSGMIVISNAVSIDFDHNDSKVSIYPNPAVDMIYFDDVVNSPAQVFIYDSIGKLLYNAEHIEDWSIDISSMAPGSYHVGILSQGQPIQWNTFVKSN